jgi:hypothetical protein
LDLLMLIAVGSDWKLRSWWDSNLEVSKGSGPACGRSVLILKRLK